jgi:hypothetical protein
LECNATSFLPLFPPEEVMRPDEMADARRARRRSVNFLVSNHRRARHVDAVGRAQLGQHRAPGLAAFASVAVVVWTDLPSGQDVAELAVELSNRGLDLLQA